MMTTIKEIHNRQNLDPADYEVLDYLDNQPPKLAEFGGDVKAADAARERWAAEFAGYFGADFRAKIHNCHHCNNGMVRYLAICVHKPTGEKLVFGSECVAKLSFPDKQTLKLAQIKARAEARTARAKIILARDAFLTEHPEVAAAMEQAAQPVHAHNHFVKDVLGKLNQYGSLSPRQIEAVLTSLARDVERANRGASEEQEKARLLAAGVTAPSGRVAVTGEVLHSRSQESDFGIQYKMLVRLDSGAHAGAKVWGTIPGSLCDGNGCLPEKGHRVSFTATFEQKADDKLFAFYSRPSKAVRLPAQAAEVAPAMNP